MKNKTNIAKTSKQKGGGGAYLPNNQNSNVSSSYNTHNLNNADKNTPFPIWEKIYLEFKTNIINDIDLNLKSQFDKNKISSFFRESKSIIIKNYIYIFPLFKSEYKYAIIDIGKNQLIFQEMPYQCFHPVYSPQFFFSIFLFTYDSSFKSDGRYNIVEFDVKTNSFNNLNCKGVAPKARNDCFCSFIYLNKLYFFGGTPKFLSDNSLNYLFSYNIKENDWKIEEYVFNSEKELINSNYIGNNFDLSCVQIEDKNIFYLIGGKYYDDIIYSEINNFNNSKLKQAKESNDIIKIQIKENGIIEFTNTKKNSKNKFGNAFTTYYKDNIYIYNKDILFLYDYKNHDISVLKKRIFAPEIEGYGTFIIHDNFLFLVGKFLNYDDCYLFKTNLDKINIKYNATQKINYEYLLNNININNNKDNSDILCEFNNPDDKKLYLNKIVLSNFSINMKNQIINSTNNHKLQNCLNLNDINYQTLIIILKWIYNNFGGISTNLNIDIYKDIISVLFKLKAKSLINIFIDNLNINENNALLLYELGNKYDLQKLVIKCHKYISDFLNSKNSDKILNFNESNEIKKKMYEQFFCEHKLYMECSVTNLNIHNLTMININNDKLDNIKQLNKNGKLFYCLNCEKVFIPNKDNDQ
jgi:hypothetical protein